MNKTSIRILFFVLLAAFAAALAGCKSESSPTAPSTTTTPPTTTNPVTPPSGSSITLTFSNNTPTAPADVVVTATVTLNGQPVPNGTAVQFTTTIGQFRESTSTSIIRTTTNGIATVTLTGSSAGTGTVTATVNDVQKSASITFSAQPPNVIPPSTNPTITTITPATGLPQGGTVITINGTNFRTPVRVIVDPGNGQPTKDAFVSSVTPTQIVAVMPPFDITTGQTLAVSITVVDEAGGPNETPVTKANAFTYQAAVLTPSIRTISPTSGPIDGGTRVAILGDAFQAPVQVFFSLAGSPAGAEAQVLRVTFNEIDVVAPAARDTSADASSPVTGPVEVKVRNVNSGTVATSPQAFRYVAKAIITAISPIVGSAAGGTDVTIDGTGFNAPVTVDVGGVRATVLSVSATEIRVRTNGLPSPCGGGGGSTVVTNVDNGDVATSPPTQSFTYVGVPALITSISGSSPITIGTGLTVNVANPGVGQLGTAFVGFTVGDQAAATTPSTIANGASQSFTVVVPPNLTFSTASCTVGGLTGTQPIATSFPVVFTNATTGCHASSAVVVNPTVAQAVCTIIPPVAVVLAPPAGQCANAQSSNVGTQSTTQPIITIGNAAPSGGNTLKITGAAISGANASDFTIAPVPTAITPVNVAPGSSTNFTVTFTPSGMGARNATVTFSTNDPVNPSVTVCLTGTGT